MPDGQIWRISHPWALPPPHGAPKLERRIVPPSGDSVERALICSAAGRHDSEAWLRTLSFDQPPRRSRTEERHCCADEHGHAEAGNERRVDGFVDSGRRVWSGSLRWVGGRQIESLRIDRLPCRLGENRHGVELAGQLSIEDRGHDDAENGNRDQAGGTGNGVVDA